MMFIFTACTSQKADYKGFWNDLRLADSGEKIMITDTISVIYSIRTLNRSHKEFMTNEIDPNGKVCILLATCKNLKWTFYELPNLDSAMSFLPNKKDLVIYVEGFGKTFPLSTFRTAGVSAQYNVNVLMFDYPSYHDEKNILVNYGLTEKNAKKSAPFLGNLLTHVQEAKASKKPWVTNKNTTLFVHSMGNIIIKEAVKKGKFQNLETALLNRVVLNNPCVPALQHKNWVDSINFAPEIFIHHNKEDKQLRGAFLIQKQKMLGSVDQHKNSKAFYIDFNPLMGEQHNAFFNKPDHPNIPDLAQNYYAKLFSGSTFPFTELKTTLEKNAYFLSEK